MSVTDAGHALDGQVRIGLVRVRPLRQNQRRASIASIKIARALRWVLPDMDGGAFHLDLLHVLGRADRIPITGLLI